ncbi:DNA-binding protein [Paenibacillus sp. IHB B 3084]|uniref:helix-turn-helix domain-containing protein n=1 Tax=Paenibacillus sp. IHB B 3084 TaxID=867076 RepID=UPI00071F97EF|nr:helix-turn-helix transcriptional regulator [Paenibacillus sp. IHB B 3084]ALP36178.1 DNA-binding protein [Paenibacillus sp. IHB B 3084]
MNHTTTIRAELDTYMKTNGLNITRLGRTAGLNAGTVSTLVNGNRTFSVDQLDRITAVMGHPRGHYYKQYMQEYLTDITPNWRRIRPFLYNCAELDKLDCIQQMADLLMDNLVYSVLLFNVAEDFFKDGKHAAAAILYESVAISERKQYSERLALCQYRLFTINIGDDQNQNFEAACHFHPFVERLDEIDQLDALKDLANVYRSLRQWAKVDKTVQKMRDKAKIQYSLDHRQHKRKKRGNERKTRGPLFGYIAYADLLCASVCEAHGDYEQALQYTYAYADLSWVKETDEDTRHWMELFQHWAQVNIYVNKLLSGDVSVLSDYVEYICAPPDKSEKELVTELLNIMMAANRYQIDVDDILQRFETEIDSFAHQQSSTDMYTQQVIPEQFARLGYELAYYYLYKGMYSVGFKYLRDALVKANILNNKIYFINCTGLFEHFRMYFVPEIHAQYQNLIEKVWLENVKKSGSSSSRN